MRLLLLVALAVPLASLALLLRAQDVDRPVRAVVAPTPAPLTPTTPAPATPERRRAARPDWPQVRWRDSRSLGTPTAGRLVAGVRLPAEGPHFVSWDPVFKRTPNRGWRRYGNDRVVRTVLRVLRGFHARHPRATRVLVGDLSRTRGGDFGRRFGPVGHVSHQNGLDVDVYYPRRDDRERAPRRLSHVDRTLAQELVDRFVRAGAERVLVGPRVLLAGPPSVVQVWPNHDDHLHARFAGD